MSNLESWSIGDTEVALYAPAEGPCNENPLKVQIPKLCPLLGTGLPKKEVVGLVSTCFINAPECKPNVSKTVNTQNYILVYRTTNRNFQYSTFTKGDQLRVEINNKDIYDMKLTTKVDPSHV